MRFLNRFRSITQVLKLGQIINNFYGSMNEHNGYELERIFGIKLEECEFYEARALVDFYPRYMKKHKKLMKLASN